MESETIHPSPTRAQAELDSAEPAIAATEQEREDEEHGSFRVGDHVYMWCSVMGIPGIFQHHGIVVEVEGDATGDDDRHGAVTIADFNALVMDDRSNGSEGGGNDGGEMGPAGGGARTSSSSGGFSALSSSSGNSGGIPSRLRQYTVREKSERTKWRKVRYGAGPWACRLRRSGTCTSAESDPPSLVISRIEFLLRNQHLIPPYHVFKSNCECVAVWCKTGSWATLQGSMFWHVQAAGAGKGAAAVAATAASAQVAVTAPAAGLWGYLGYTTTTSVPLLTMHPVLVPAIAGWAVVSIGAPMAMLRQYKFFWEETMVRLNDAFWASSAVDRQDVFIDCITNWSSMKVSP